MKVILLSLAAVFASAALGQRITGSDECVQSCYQISTAVTQCSDLSDTGVISCICPNTTATSQLNACNDCLNTLQGISDFEKNSITTLHDACANGGSTAGLSSAQERASSLLSASSTGSSSAPTGTVARSAASSLSTGLSSAASAATASPTGAASKTGASLAGLALAGLVAAAAL